MGERMTNSAIPTLTKNIITSQPVVIPVFHEVAVRLLHMMNSSFYEIEEVITLVQKDPALASEMLRHANSAFYSGKVPITTIKDAIIRLGSQQIVNLAFTASMSTSRSNNPAISAYMKKLWLHCCAVAKTSSCLALKIGSEKGIPDLNHDEVYLAGLLHDIGKLYLLKVIDRLMVSDIIHPGTSLIEEILDELNIQQGIKVMKHYNMPEIYSDLLDRLVKEQWQSGSNDYFVAAVRLADKMHSRGEDGIAGAELVEVDDICDEMSFLGVEDVSYLQELAKAIN